MSALKSDRLVLKEYPLAFWLLGGLPILLGPFLLTKQGFFYGS